MSDYKLMNKKDLSRLSEAEVQALQETDKATNETIKLVEKYQSLYKDLEDLPKRENEEIMVPLGKVAYMPGKLVNTSRVMMALGESHFIESSTKHAQTVVRRRINSLEDHVGKLKEQERLFEDRLNYTEQFTQERKEFVEISEECTEEEYAKFKAQHRENFTKSRSTTQTQTEEKMNLDDFFANYNDDDDDDGDDAKNKAREINDGIASESNVEDDRIHEGYKSLLSDFGIDCKNIEFTNDVTQGLHDELNEDNEVTTEEPRTKSGASENDDSSGDIGDCTDTLPSDGSEQFPFKHSGKGFKEDAGFQILLNKLGFNFDETGDTKSSSTVGVFSGQLSSEVDTNAEPMDDSKKPIASKKSVSWGGEVVKNTDDDDHGEGGDDSEGECTPETILLNFKHSQAVPASLKPCMDEIDPILIQSPADIYTKTYKLKSILKDSKEPLKTSVQEKPVEKVKVATKTPAKVLRPAVSALVVERISDNHLQGTDTSKHNLPSQAPSENSRPQVSKFKAQMARKYRQAS